MCGKEEVEEEGDDEWEKDWPCASSGLGLGGEMEHCGYLVHSPQRYCCSV